jgi:hypothetical protein
VVPVFLTNGAYVESTQPQQLDLPEFHNAIAEARLSCGATMFQYRLFKHDGEGNFSLLQEFEAKNDEVAGKFIAAWRLRPLELWQSSRKVRSWA